MAQTSVLQGLTQGQALRQSPSILLRQKRGVKEICHRREFIRNYSTPTMRKSPPSHQGGKLRKIRTLPFSMPTAMPFRQRSARAEQKFRLLLQQQEKKGPYPSSFMQMGRQNQTPSLPIVSHHKTPMCLLYRILHHLSSQHKNQPLRLRHFNDPSHHLNLARSNHSR